MHQSLYKCRRKIFDRTRTAPYCVILEDCHDLVISGATVEHGEAANNDRFSNDFTAVYGTFAEYADIERVSVRLKLMSCCANGANAIRGAWIMRTKEIGYVCSTERAWYESVERGRSTGKTLRSVHSQVAR